MNSYNVPFIVNDDVDLAIEVGADGIHLGQEDGYISSVRDKVGPDMLIGVSTHNVAEALAAADAGADYIGIGPVYGQVENGYAACYWLRDDPGDSIIVARIADGRNRRNF